MASKIERTYSLKTAESLLFSLVMRISGKYTLAPALTVFSYDQAVSIPNNISFSYKVIFDLQTSICDKLYLHNTIAFFGTVSSTLLKIESVYGKICTHQRLR